MTSRRVALAQLTVAVLAFAGCVASWLSSGSVETVAPLADGEPQMTSTVYDAPLIALALLLAGVAAVAAVTGIARLKS